jgi:hypothetical protein
MRPNETILLTFGLLALTVISLWIPAPAIRGVRAWPWCLGLLLACLAGLSGRLLDWHAPLAIAGYAALAFGAEKAGRAPVRIPLLLLTGVTAFLFALDLVPGFHNPVLAANIRFSPDTPPFTLRASFDTAAAGIVLMGVFCRRIYTAAEWGAMLAKVWPVTLSTLVVVLGIGWLARLRAAGLQVDPVLGLVPGRQPAVHLRDRGSLLPRPAARPGGAGPVGAALGFVCRGGAVRDPVWPRPRARRPGAGAARDRRRTALRRRLPGTKRIEGAILNHFALNAVHFLAFSYPALAA